jgi:N-formylglutamate amidohydrolase
MKKNKAESEVNINREDLQSLLTAVAMGEHGLDTIMDILAETCVLTSEYISKNQQNKRLAYVWMQYAESIEECLQKCREIQESYLEMRPV